ncbi:hypothetical protein J7I80_12425, partial [Bacillus sp. ISL-41]|uniref:hypothetical protein n=1 Tax=Bacillus sp. ISL-41 TaxID=2819127 RepID=UPI001BEB0A4C
PNEVKERLHWSALQRLSGLNEALALFYVQLQRLAPRDEFGPPNEVKERLHRSALQRLLGLNEALALFVLF